MSALHRDREEVAAGWQDGGTLPACSAHAYRDERKTEQQARGADFWRPWLLLETNCGGKIAYMTVKKRETGQDLPRPWFLQRIISCGCETLFAG